MNRRGFFASLLAAPSAIMLAIKGKLVVPVKCPTLVYDEPFSSTLRAYYYNSVALGVLKKKLVFNNLSSGENLTATEANNKIKFFRYSSKEEQ